jgi:hypothetical protein
MFGFLVQSFKKHKVDRIRSPVGNGDTDPDLDHKLGLASKDKEHDGFSPAGFAPDCVCYRRDVVLTR